jgi:hypothetical protein
MSEEIADALDDAAKKAEQGLSQDFADTVDNPAQSAEGKAAGAGSGELTPGSGPGDGEAGTPQPLNAGPGGPGVPAEGPPWPAGDDIAGSARGKSLRPVNKRHTVSGVKAGPRKPRTALSSGATSRR